MPSSNVYWDRVARGVCVYCSKPGVTARRCAECLAADRKYHVKRKQTLTSERSVQSVVEDYLTLNDWLWAHHPDSRKMRGTPGLPDIVAVHKVTGATLWVECKSSRGALTGAQAEWCRALTTGGQQHLLATPKTLDGVLQTIKELSG